MNSIKIIFFTLLLFTINLSAENKKIQHVSVQLEWKHQFEFAGFYAALEQGYYKDVGLDVSIKEYHSNTDVIDDVLSGISTYGMSSSQLILERLSGKKIVQLASYLKQNALVLITKPNIRSIEDLKNKTIMAGKGELTSSSLAAMLQEHRMSISDFTVVPHTFNIDDFINGDIDAMTGFISNQPYLLDQKNISYKILNPSADGIYSYDVELFTSEDEAKKHPIRTQKFIDATRKGWEYALINKSKIVDLIYEKYSKVKSKDALLYEASIICKLMKTDFFKVGAIVPELTQLNTNMYIKLGMVEKHWDLEGFIFNSKAKKINLTSVESNFIKTHPIIRFSDVKWEPFASIADDNTYSGIFKDYYKLIEERTGLKFEFIKVGDGINFQSILDALKNKEIDIIDGTGKTEARKKYALFAGPLLQVSLAIVSHSTNMFSTLESLKGKTISVAKGSTASEYLKENFPEIQLSYTNSIDEALYLVRNKRVDATIDNIIVLDHIMKNNTDFQRIEISGIINYKFNIYSLIRDDYAPLRQIIDKAINSISKKEILSINNKLLQSTTAFDKTKKEDFLSSKELAFIESHPKIVLGTSNKWKPYVIVKKDGTITGYDADVLNLINEVSGSNFVLEAGDWGNMQVKAKAKKIDGLSTGGVHEERKAYLNFSDTYISMKKMLITSKENPKNIYILDDLKGKTIAIHKSNLVDEKTAQKFPTSKILRFDTIEEVITSIGTGKADAMFGNGATFYLANELGLPYLKRVATLDDSLELSFGVRKDWSEAISIINKSLDHIGEYKLLELKNKWFWEDKATLLDKSYKALVLTDREKQYLKDKKEIRMCVDPDWMPFEKIENGIHIGLSADYMNIFKSKIGIPVNLVLTNSWAESVENVKKRKCDILPLAMETKERKKFMNFTKPYLTIPLVIATRNDKFFISNFNKLEGKIIGIEKSHAYVELLKNKYPKTKFVEVDNVTEGLKKVIKGELFGYVENLTTIGYKIQKYFPTELKIAGQFDEKLTLGVGIRNDEPILLDILNKAINSVDTYKRNNILNQWVSIKYEHSYDYENFWKILSPFLLLVLFIIIRQYILKKYNKKLKSQVEEKIEELRVKDEMLIQEHKMAAMGELLSMIAHQWKQPLGAINFALMGIEVKLASGFFNLEKQSDREKFLSYLERKHQSINSYVDHLSTTTDDFRNFFNPNKSKETVNLTQPIENALSIIQSQIINHGIELVKKYDSDEELSLFKNELVQVILNILKNAEDNFMMKKIENPKITIETEKIDSSLIINICDNGGGVPQDIIDKIFDPYFSTKDEKNGTGLGLYMSKIMIEKHNNGTLKIYNTQEGACFKITFNRDV